MSVKKVILLTVLILGLSTIVKAQDYYDDDIYYDASKVKKTAVKKVQNKASDTGNAKVGAATSVYDYPAADNYVVDGGSTRDVDEYNRRYATENAQTPDSLSNSDFQYTRRIEKFYNPTIVSGSGDEVLQEYYYISAQQPAEVNIYVDAPSWISWYPRSWYASWLSPWCYDPWDPWYGPSWYYGPSWSWYGYWGPSWYPGYYPGYYPGHHHHPPHYAGPATHRPATPGAYRPARPGQSGYAPGRRPGYSKEGNNSNYRPSGSRDKNSSVSSGRRPSSSRNSGVSSSSGRRSSENSGYSRQSNNNQNRNSGYSRSSNSGRSSGYSGGSRSGGGRSGGGGRGGRH